MSKQFKVEQFKAAKRYYWNMYSHKPWFCQCVYARDEERHVVGVEVRFDPTFKERFSFATETDEGVPAYLVQWDPEKHGERYDREKHG